MSTAINKPYCATAGHSWMRADSGELTCFFCGIPSIPEVPPPRMTERQVADEIVAIRARLTAAEKKMLRPLRADGSHPDCPVCTARRRKNAERMRVARAKVKK